MTRRYPILAMCFLVLVSLATCGAGGGGGSQPTSVPVLVPCNGSPRLCDKKLNEVTFLGTHNSYSNAEEKWELPNQQYGLSKQLTDGVRYLVLDVYLHEGKATLCHSFCHVGKESLVSGFSKIVDFLKSNPNEVLVFDFENYIEGEVMQEAMRESGLLPYLHAQEKGKPWPTLRQLIHSGKRIVAFSDRNGGSFSGFHRTQDFVASNGWGFKTLAEQDCPAKREDPNVFYNMNHQYVNALGIPTPTHSATANTREVILAHHQKCLEQTGRKMNTVQMDFYHIGDGFKVVQELNGITP